MKWCWNNRSSGERETHHDSSPLSTYLRSRHLPGLPGPQLRPLDIYLALFILTLTSQNPSCFSYPSTTPTPPQPFFPSLPHSTFSPLPFHLSSSLYFLFSGSCRGVQSTSPLTPTVQTITLYDPYPKTPGSATLPGTYTLPNPLFPPLTHY